MKLVKIGNPNIISLEFELPTTKKELWHNITNPVTIIGLTLCITGITFIIWGVK